MPPPAPLGAIVAACSNHRALIDSLAAALADEPPLLARDGGFIRPGYRAELDEQRTLRDDSRKTIAALEAKYRAASGVTSLKIRHNNMIGYHIEVTATHADKLDLAALGFTRRQSMSNATRFSTAELADLETRIGRAADQALALELQIFETLVGEAMAVSAAVVAAGRALAALDVSAALADLAAQRQLRAAGAVRGAPHSPWSAAGIRWSRRRCCGRAARASCPTIASSDPRGGCGC